MILKIFTQEKLHDKFKTVRIIEDKCIQCRKCIKRCPLNIFSMQNGKVAMVKAQSVCILCTECFHNCQAGAIEHPYIERLKDAHAALEQPACVVIL